MIDYSKDMTVGKYVYHHSESETSRLTPWPSEGPSVITVRIWQDILTLNSVTRAWYLSAKADDGLPVEGAKVLHKAHELPTLPRY